MQELHISHKLPEAVAEKLREMIIADSLTEGDRLPTESDLMARFGVSRSTVREAAKILQTENIVEIRRGQGTYISKNPGIARDPLGLRFARQRGLLQSLMEARMLIEPGVAYLAAQRRTDEDLFEMRTLISQMDEAYENKRDYTEFDIRFHTRIAKSTRNNVLERLLPVINESIITGYHQTVHVSGSYPKASERHTELYLAISRQDAHRAMRVAETHIRQTLTDSNIVLGGNDT